MSNLTKSVSSDILVILICFAFYLSANKLFSQQLDITWENLGPGGGGTMYAPAISPLDPNLMFIACDMSGVYRSTDAGKSWTMINYHQLNGSISVPPVFHPTDPNIIWDEMGSKFMRSTDAGITWNKVWDMPSTPTSMICSRSEPLALYLAFSRDSLYFSSDGINFTKQGKIKPLYLAENENIVVAADKNNVWYSIDKGFKFNNFYIFSEPVQGVAVSDSGILVLTNKTCVRFKNNLSDIKPVLTSDSINGGDYKFVRAEGKYIWVTSSTESKVFVSTDGGDSFKGHYYCKSWSTGLQNAQPDWIAVDIGCGWGVAAQGICISRQNPDLGIWTDMGSSYILSDTGKSWTPDFTEYADDMPIAKAKHWKTRGLDVTTNWDIFQNPYDKKYVQSAYTDILGSISEDGGNSWRTTHHLGIPDEWSNTTYNFAFDKDNNILWGAFSAKHDISSWNGAGWNPGAYNLGGICISTDYGKNWTPQMSNGLPDLPVTRIAIDFSSPAQSRRIYAAVFTSGIWKTENGGKSWVRCVNGLDMGDGTSTIDGPNNHITEVDVYPNGDVFALKSMYYRSPTAKNDGGLWKSTNHGG